MQNKITVSVTVHDFIWTIKLFRDATNMGLKNTKDLVESLRNGSLLMVTPTQLIALINVLSVPQSAFVNVPRTVSPFILKEIIAPPTVDLETYVNEHKF